jgi:hypothetical protein
MRVIGNGVLSLAWLAEEAEKMGPEGAELDEFAVGRTRARHKNNLSIMPLAFSGSGRLNLRLSSAMLNGVRDRLVYSNPSNPIAISVSIIIVVIVAGPA